MVIKDIKAALERVSLLREEIGKDEENGGQEEFDKERRKHMLMCMAPIEEVLLEVEKIAENMNLTNAILAAINK